MTIMLQLSALALKGAAKAAGETLGFGAVGAAGEGVVDFLANRFTDHSQRLNKALTRSTDRAWRAVEIALAGNSWWDRCKRTLGTGDERAFREQVQAFLTANPLDGVDGFGSNFRVTCQAQLQAARKSGLLKPTPPPIRRTGPAGRRPVALWRPRRSGRGGTARGRVDRRSGAPAWL